MKGQGAAVWVSRGARTVLRRPRSGAKGQEECQIVRLNPEAVLLFASLGPEGRKAFEMFLGEARRGEARRGVGGGLAAMEGS
ncbi:hypothetical protein, partial [Actinomadura darangshiensis]|uniref:hypothetical protein n=1 Tax=Actinomadura darangshiensis TaxID=705336 RepID=UPI001A9D00A7